jgi:transcriptional regulator with XRE-family HTH domain
MDTAQASSFAQLLKRYRRAAGLTQEGLAERANLSARAISDLERGIKRMPYRDTVDMLADALELGPEDRAALHASVERRRGRAAAAPAGEARGDGQVSPAAPPARLVRLRSHPRLSVALSGVAILVAVAALLLTRNSSAARSPRLASSPSLTFDMLLTLNPAGHPQSAFRAGSVMFVRPEWTLDNVSGVAYVTITCALRLPGRARPAPCPATSVRHLKYTGNGRHASTLIVRVPRVSSSFRLVVGVAVGSQAQQRTVTIRIGGPKPPTLAVLPIAACSPVPAVGVRTTCSIALYLTNDGDHTLSFMAVGQGVIAHLARGVRGISFSSSVGSGTVRGSSVIWKPVQIRPGSTEEATLDVSFTPTASQLGSRAGLFAGVDAIALDRRTGKQVTASFGILTTSGHVIQKP